MKINDLHDLDRPSAAAKALSGQDGATSPPMAGLQPLAFPRHRFPLQIVKEQAPGRLTHSRLLRFDENVNTQIQVFLWPCRYSVKLGLFGWNFLAQRARRAQR